MKINLRLFGFILAVFSLSFLISCTEDDPTEPHDEHFHAEGIVLYLKGLQEIKIFQNEFISANKKIELLNGEITDLYDVKFLDEDGNEFDPPDDEDFSLDWEVSNTDIIAIEQLRPGDWSFRIDAKKTGSTDFKLMVKHIDHNGFISPQIPVEVE